MAAELPVSRETSGKLSRYVELLEQWQARINLVAPSTLPEIWSRHILDSAQVFALKPGARCWLDLGSGGGLPGLVIACFLAGQSGSRIDLVESNGKKAAFLRHAANELNLPAHIHASRIEATISTLPQPDVITARALAPLDELLSMTNLLLKRGAVALFPKGRGFEEELTAAGKNWHFSSKLHKSVTDPEARILEIAMA